MTLTRMVLLLAVLTVLGAAGFAARPAAPTAEQRVERLIAELRCPVCQGLSVASSPSETAREMRDLVIARVAEGRTDEEVRAEFRASYGDWVFLAPPTDGFAALMWLLPLALLGTGAAIAWRRAAARPSREPAVPPAELAALRERVRREEAADL